MLANGKTFYSGQTLVCHPHKFDPKRIRTEIYVSRHLLHLLVVHDRINPPADVVSVRLHVDGDAVPCEMWRLTQELWDKIEKTATAEISKPSGEISEERRDRIAGRLNDLRTRLLQREFLGISVPYVFTYDTTLDI